MARVDAREVAAALPSYEIGGELGRGGFGTVLAARHKLIGREVAVKVLLDSSSADEDLRARFLAEARVLAGLDHPHVVRIFDYVEHDGLCLLVMEQLTGGSLRRRAAGVNPADACAIGLAGAAALTAAHDSGVLHRDMKPDNLLFTADGLTKVTDFGIAKILETTAATTTGMVGTPRYMAPEQIAGTRLGPATDLYALAVVLYELLAQRPPFERSLPVAALLHHHLSVPPQPLPEAPPALAEVVFGCLAKDPTARPPSALAFAVELARAGTSSFGPDWLSRCGVPVRLADEVLVAAGHLSSGNTPPAPWHSGPQHTGGPQYPSAPQYLNGGYPQPGSYPPGGPGRPASMVAPTRRDIDGARGGRRRAIGPGGRGPAGGGRRIALVAGVTALCLVALGIGVPFALGAFDGESRAAKPGYAGVTIMTALSNTEGIALGRDGTLYVADSGSSTNDNDGRVVALSSDGQLRTVAGIDPATGPAPSGTPAPIAVGDEPAAVGTPLPSPVAVALGPDDTIYIADYYGEQVLKISNGTISAFAGVGAGRDGFTGNSGEATGIELGYPEDLAVGPDGTVYVAAGTNVLKITKDGRIASAIAPGDDDEQFTLPAPTSNPTATRSATPLPTGPVPAKLTNPSAVAVAEDGTLYVADKSQHVVIKVNPATGAAERIAGSGNSGYSGDGGPAVDSTFNSPTGLAVSPDDSLYVTDQYNHAIRRIGRDGIITTVAGGGDTTDSGDGATATTVSLSSPTRIAVDSSTAIYFTTYTNATVRRVSPDGILRTVLANPK